jgi:hypothetical protein
MGAKITIRNNEFSVKVKESVWDIIETINDVITDPSIANFIPLTQDKSLYDMGNIALVGEKFIVNINDIILITNN